MERKWKDLCCSIFWCKEPLCALDLWNRPLFTLFSLALGALRLLAMVSFSYNSFWCGTIRQEILLYPGSNGGHRGYILPLKLCLMGFPPNKNYLQAITLFYVTVILFCLCEACVGKSMLLLWYWMRIQFISMHICWWCAQNGTRSWGYKDE